MDALELFKQVRKIEIKTRGLSSNIFAGQYHSAFKGRGMAFSEVREYQFGDDVRDIDWNVTARFRRPFVKVFEEERELTVMLLIDVSGSLDFGTAQRTKREMATEMAAILLLAPYKTTIKLALSSFPTALRNTSHPKRDVNTSCTSFTRCSTLNPKANERTLPRPSNISLG